LFSVDSDIVLPDDTLVKMLAANKDIVSGLYIQRIPDTHTLEVYADLPGGGCTNIPYKMIKDTGVVEIAACGMGCALINSEVFRKMKYPHFFYKSALTMQETVSEDVYFCLKARDHGFKIWADSSIQCDHKGSTYFKVEEIASKSHLEKVAEQDLLPAGHTEYIKKMNITPAVIYDIGSCVQHWTRKAKEIWPDSKYYLFDAAQSVTPFLEKSGDEYIVSVLSDVDGKIVDFYEDAENPGGNSYYLETTGAFTEKHKTKRATVKLDTIISNNNWSLPDLIKIDAQGAELDILKGATHALLSCKDIIVECQHVDYNQGAPKVEQVISYLNEIGFKLVDTICKNNIDGDYHFTRVY
jgi:FkbM family methyltransferase